MSKAVDLKDFYKIPADNRDLNYNKYYTKGNEIDENITDYNSHNTRRLSKAETIELLLQIDYIKKELENE